MDIGKSLFVRYGGTWDDNTNAYVGGHLKGIIVHANVTYSELKKWLCGVIKVNWTDYDLLIKVPYDLAYTTPPMYITDDDDLRFGLIQEHISKVSFFVTTTLDKASTKMLPVMEVHQIVGMIPLGWMYNHVE